MNKMEENAELIRGYRIFEIINRSLYFALEGKIPREQTKEIAELLTMTILDFIRNNYTPKEDKE
jgi:hypothetical protein